MKLVNKPFTMPEYNKCQFNRYLTRIEAILPVYDRQQISYTGQVSYSRYCELAKLALELLERAYGNNNT